MIKVSENPKGIIVMESENSARMMILQRPSESQLRQYEVHYPNLIDEIREAVDKYFPEEE